MYEPMSDSGEPLEQTTEAPAPPPHPWRGLQQGRNSVTKKWGRIALDTDDVVESKRKSALIDEPGYVNIITSPLTESVDRTLLFSNYRNQSVKIGHYAYVASVGRVQKKHVK
jgi:hypothetical protein